MASRSDIPNDKVIAMPLFKAHPLEVALNLLDAPFPTFDVGSDPVSSDSAAEPPSGPDAGIAPRANVMDQINRA